jgi:hypothetical protein
MQTQAEGRRLGGCQCGHIRYELNGQPVVLSVCHCLECQKQSASAFGMTLRVRRQDFRLVHGVPRYWSRPTDSGRTTHCAFCPECGSRVWHQAASDSELVSIKAGSLDEPVDFGTAMHIWTKRKLKGVIIPPGSVQFPEGPN